MPPTKKIRTRSCHRQQQQQQQQQHSVKYFIDCHVNCLFGVALALIFLISNGIPNAAAGLCLLNGILVAKPTALCEQQIGCRAIQKTGHCCPDYRCDCAKDGQTYANGDKLVDPATPCTVCYCQGGEILCSSVTCFHRDDCIPQFVPGRCCPEYDNCPVSTSESNGAASPHPTADVKAEHAPHGAALNPKITIKEITKPVEIRITDENKAISVHQMHKPSSQPETATARSSAPGAQKAAIATRATDTSSTATATAEASNSSLGAGSTASVIEQSNGNSSKPSTGASDFSADTNLQSTKLSSIHHATDATQQKPPLRLTSVNESLKLSASVTYSPPTNGAAVDADVGAGSSGQEGEKAALLADFGTQYFQRGDGAESNGFHGNKVNIKREFLDTTTAGANAEDFTTAETIDAVKLDNKQQSSAEAEAEPDAAGSDSVYHVVVTTDGPPRTPEGSPTDADSKSAAAAFQDASLGSAVAAKVLANSSTEPPTAKTSTTAADADSSTAAPTADSSRATEGPKDEGSPPQQQPATAEDEDSVVPPESNPAYPSLPEDDFSLRDVSFPLPEGEESADEPRSIGARGGDAQTAAVQSSAVHRADSYVSPSGIPAVPPPTNSPKHAEEDANADAVLVPGPLDFQPAVEGRQRSSSSGGGREEKPLNKSETEVGSVKNSDVDALELVTSGPLPTANTGNATKEREPTTPRPIARLEDLDIDEVGLAGADGPETEPELPVADPKLDVESLKLNDDGADEVEQQGAVSREDDSLAESTKAVAKQAAAEPRAVEEVAVADRVQRFLLQRV